MIQTIVCGLCQCSWRIIQTRCPGNISKCDIIRRALPLVAVGRVSTGGSHSGQLSRCCVITDALVGRNGPHRKCRIYRNAVRCGCNSGTSVRIGIVDANALRSAGVPGDRDGIFSGSSSGGDTTTHNGPGIACHPVFGGIDVPGCTVTNSRMPGDRGNRQGIDRYILNGGS